MYENQYFVDYTLQFEVQTLKLLEGHTEEFLNALSRKKVFHEDRKLIGITEKIENLSIWNFRVSDQQRKSKKWKRHTISWENVIAAI